MKIQFLISKGSCKGIQASQQTILLDSFVVEKHFLYLPDIVK